MKAFMAETFWTNLQMLCYPAWKPAHVVVSDKGQRERWKPAIHVDMMSNEGSATEGDEEVIMVKTLPWRSDQVNQICVLSPLHPWRILMRRTERHFYQKDHTSFNNPIILNDSKASSFPWSHHENGWGLSNKEATYVCTISRYRRSVGGQKMRWNDQMLRDLRSCNALLLCPIFFSFANSDCINFFIQL